MFFLYYFCLLQIYTIYNINAFQRIYCKKEEKFLNSGGKLIFPLPESNII